MTDQNPGQHSATDWVENLFAMQAAQEQEEIAREQRDELTHRRTFKDLMTRYQQLTPAERALMDTEIAVFNDAEAALREGRAAYAHGDLTLAETRLRVAAGHELGESAAYLAVIYHRLGRPELAAAWQAISQDAGIPIDDLDNPPSDWNNDITPGRS